MKQVTIAGMGPGSAGCMTQEVCRAVKQADVLILLEIEHLIIQCG